MARISACAVGPGAAIGPLPASAITCPVAGAAAASRGEVERLRAAGGVALTGGVLTPRGVKIEGGDIVTADGEPVADAEPARLFRYHKPVGLVTTHNDPKGRPTVFQALP